MTSRAAIYARVSTDEQAQSVETQEREARRYAEARGWSIDEAHVYRDVGASGAEWLNRPELGRLMKDCARAPRPWDVLLVRDQDRIGRDAGRTMVAIESILDSGARVIEYSTGHEAQSDLMARGMIGFRGIFAQLERGMIAKRTRDAHLAMARQGRVTGGTVYGYRNVRSAEGVHHEIDDVQAEVVREVFTRRATGESVRRIAIDLNRRGLPSPHAGQRGTGSWSPSVLWTMLHNARYIGVIEWGKKRKGYRDGTRTRTAQAPTEVLRIEAPHLRLIPSELWTAVRALDEAPDTRAPKRRGKDPKHLLIGMAVCRNCGGRIAAHAGRWGSGPCSLYLCGSHRDRGDAVCPVTSRRPVAEVDGQVIEWLRTQYLTPSRIRRLVAAARAEMEAAAAAEVDTAEVARLTRELAKLEGELRRLGEALASGAGAMETVLGLVRDREARAKEARAELARVTAPAPSPGAVAWEAVEAEALARLGELQRLLTENIPEARRVLAEVLDGPIECGPSGPDRGAGWRITGRARTGISVVSPGGADDNTRAESEPFAIESPK